MNDSPSAADRQAVLQRALCELKEMRLRIAAAEQARTEPIALIGIGCRFPGGADTPADFWQLVRSGTDAIAEIPPDRWEADSYYDPNPETPGKMYVRRGGFVGPVDRFDAGFFNILPREAAQMDPQQRLLLEVAWEALEHAGQAPDRLAGSRTGVFVGISTSEYSWLSIHSGIPADGYSAVGAALNVTAGRLSHVLGLRGPSIALDTACSSSLVAVHLACQSLRRGESDLALAGGTHLMLSPLTYVALCRARMLAPDGRCKTFDAAADGYGRGEGVGVVVLKRLRDAQRDRNPILALIRGTAISHDGLSSGLTVPSRQAQEALILAALDDAGVTPEQVSYVESHGTGTALGDPIELRALAAALGKKRAPDARCAVGSVKTNIGHLEAASGIAGLIKVALALQHAEIPPHLHFRTPNPHLDWDALPFTVPTAPTPWQAAERTRIAGVSSFGFSGIISHAVLEEAPARPQPESDLVRPAHILCLSAKSEGALHEMVGRMARHIDAVPAVSLADVCFTANAGRAHFSKRLALVAESLDDVSAELADVAAGRPARTAKIGQFAPGERPKVAFLFTGQGSQYVGMGRELYLTQPTFRRTMDRCDALLRPLLERPLLSVLHADDSASSPLHQTAYTQPALFALQYALAELWRSWGLEPAALLGHSVGEYAAACIAGVFSLEDGLALVAERARLMQALAPGGAMLAVAAGEERVAALRARLESVDIAARNGPQSTVLAGPRAQLELLHTALQAAGIKSRWLAVSHAFHSPLMDPMLDALERRAAQVSFSPPRVRLISNLTGRQVEQEVCTPAYWRRHTREPVQFASGVRALCELGIGAFVEIGPAPVLLGLARQCAARDSGLWLPSLREGTRDWLLLLRSLAELYVAGVDVDWAGFDRDYARLRVPLPAYPFARGRHWISKPHRTEQPLASPGFDATLHPLLGRRLPSPLEAIQFQSQLRAGADALPVTTDQLLFGIPVVSGAVLLMMAHAAVAEAWRPDLSPGDVYVDHIEFARPLILPEEQPVTVQIVLQPRGQDTATFQVYSLDGGVTKEEPGQRWNRHTTGTIRLSPPEPAAAARTPRDVRAIQAACTDEVSGEAMYREMEQGGTRRMGPAFRIIEHVWRRDGEALARIGPLQATAGSQTGRYRVDPARLIGYAMAVEGAGNTMFAALPLSQRTTAEQVYMAMETRCFHNTWKVPADSIRWCHAVCRSAEAEDSFLVDVYLLDEDGAVVAWAEGTRMRRVGSALLAGAVQRQARRRPAAAGLTAESLKRTPPQERLPRLIDSLQQQFMAASGLQARDVSPEKSLLMLGIDSLMAVDFKKLVEDGLRTQVPLAELLEGPSLRQLAQRLMEQLGVGPVSDPVPPGASGQGFIASIGAETGARLRLFCFPYGGGGASVYRTWPAGLPADIEVCPIHLPGREARLAEPPVDQLEPLLDSLEHAILPWLDRPFAFFGSSMGALLCFELARRLRKRHARSPSHLFVAAFSAPHLPNSIDARWSSVLLNEQAETGGRSELAIVQALCAQGILPAIFVENAELRAAMWPTLRADFLLVHGYRHCDEEPLDCPISAFGGLRDIDVTPAMLQPWRQHTTGPFNLYMVNGAHLFLESDRTRILQVLSQHLRS